MEWIERLYVFAIVKIALLLLQCQNTIYHLPVFHISLHKNITYYKLKIIIRDKTEGDTDWQKIFNNGDCDTGKKIEKASDENLNISELSDKT